MAKIVIAFLLVTSITTSIAKEKNMDMRAGLWEITTSSDLLKLAQHIPKNQLKGIAELAKEYGLEMPQFQNGAAISQACITQEMAKQRILPNFHQETLNCTTNKAIRKGNQYHVNFTCNSAMLNGDGNAKGTITSAEHFSGTSHFKGVAQGASVNEKANIQGKWISANCAKVKPL